MIDGAEQKLRPKAAYDKCVADNRPVPVDTTNYNSLSAYVYHLNKKHNRKLGVYKGRDEVFIVPEEYKAKLTASSSPLRYLRLGEEFEYNARVAPAQIERAVQQARAQGLILEVVPARGVVVRRLG